MAIETNVDRAFLNNAHEQEFTIVGIDTTGRVIKWAASVMDADDIFDATSPDLEFSSAVTAAMFVRVSEGPTDSTVRFVLDDSDTAALAAGRYHFQLEVFDSGGNNPVVVATGVLTFILNIAETL